MRIALLPVGFLLLAGATVAQAPQDSFQPVATMTELMLSLIYPASNDILLFINRGAPKDDKEWAAVQRSAVVLAESGNLLMMRGRARDQNDWLKDAKMLVDVGAAAYKAARTKDLNALTALSGPLDMACVTCHKQYRPEVHPRP